MTAHVALVGRITSTGIRLTTIHARRESAVTVIADPRNAGATLASAFQRLAATSGRH